MNERNIMLKIHHPFVVVMYRYSSRTATTSTFCSSLRWEGSLHVVKRQVIL